MPDDQVTIDPEFRPPRPDGGQGRWLRLAGVVGVATAAFILGWLIRSPAPSEPDAAELVASTSTTATTRRSTTSTTVAEPVELAVPLGTAVPGFGDTITMTHWDGERIQVLYWRASQSAPETIASFDERGDAGRFAGLDASGRWVAQIGESGLLSVRPVPERINETQFEEFDQAIDVRVASAVWHDHDPGRLAWVKCSRSADDADPEPRRIATVYTYNVTATEPGEPMAEFTIDGGCVAGWGISPQLGSWGIEGVRYWSENNYESLIRPDGTTVALPLEGEHVVAPDGSAAVIGHDRPGESYLLSSDGTTRSPVPGLAENEWLEGALWSPNGALLAYGSRPGEEAVLVIRIVDMDTGSVVAQVITPDWESWPVTWSTDSRFLLLQQWPRETNGREPPENAGRLMFYETTAGTSEAVPLPPEVWDIRTVEPLSVSDLFTPVEWGIVLDEEPWGPGVFTVSMEVEFRPLLPDQVEDASGQLIWDETVVDLCNIGINGGDSVVHIGDTFQTIEGCGTNPTAMQDAFDEYGLPIEACLTARVDDVDHEYCAPLE